MLKWLFVITFLFGVQEVLIDKINELMQPNLRD